MAVGTTRRISDGSAVDFSTAREAWASAARPLLEETARKYNSYLTYQELAEAVQEVSGIKTGVPFRHWIGSVLERVAMETRPGEPILTSLVVTSGGTVGSGYGEMVARREGQRPIDLDLHAAAERLACYKRFGAELPAGGGEPTLTRKVADRRKTRKGEQSPSTRKTCPTCFVEMPFSGVCENCS